MGWLHGKKAKAQKHTIKARFLCLFLCFCLSHQNMHLIVLYRRMIARLRAVMLNSEIKEDLTSYQRSAGSFSIG